MELSTDLIPLRMFDLLKKKEKLSIIERKRQKEVFFGFVDAAKVPFKFAEDHQLDIDDLMDQAAGLINREADFVTTPDELEWRGLEMGWCALIDQIIERMNAIEPTRNYDAERQQLVCFCITNTRQRFPWARF